MQFAFYAKIIFGEGYFMSFSTENEIYFCHLRNFRNWMTETEFQYCNLHKKYSTHFTERIFEILVTSVML